MAIEGKGDGRLGRRLRLGMVGGGQGAFIGGVHRVAARLDDRFELVAGALSADPAKAKASAVELRIAPERAYGSYAEMAAKEAARADGIDAVAIVTPNDVHHPAAKAFLEAGIHVICDKPMTTSLEDALDLVQTVRRTGLVFGLTHNYTGFPMVREAREMVAAGELGEIRVMQAEYAQDWLTTRLEETGQKQAAWRTDPARRAAAPRRHRHPRLQPCRLHQRPRGGAARADLATFVPAAGSTTTATSCCATRAARAACSGRARWRPATRTRCACGSTARRAASTGARSFPTFSTVPAREAAAAIVRAHPSAGKSAGRATRIPPGHVEGYFEGFANIYSDCAELITAKLENRAPDPGATLVPTVEDGAKGVRFITGAVNSSARGSVWTDLGLRL